MRNQAAEREGSLRYYHRPGPRGGHGSDRVSIKPGALGGEFAGDLTEIGIGYVTLNTSDGPEHLPNSQVLAAAVRPQPPAD